MLSPRYEGGYLLRCVALLILVSLPIGILRASGTKVKVGLTSGNQVEGELLMLVDSTLVLAKEYGLPEERLRADSGEIVKVRMSEIQTFTLCGRSYLADGLLLGMVGGVGIGALLAYTPSGFDTYNSNYDATGPGPAALVVGFLGGAVLGGFCGEMSSTDDEEISTRGWHRLGYLKSLTRYFDREIPSFLEKYTHP